MGISGGFAIETFSDKLPGKLALGVMYEKNRLKGSELPAARVNLLDGGGFTRRKDLYANLLKGVADVACLVPINRTSNLRRHLERAMVKRRGESASTAEEEIRLDWSEVAADLWSAIAAIDREMSAERADDAEAHDEVHAR